MTTSEAYYASIAYSNVENQIKLLQAQVLLGWEKEARSLSLLGLQDGMSVIELGSGPGFFTEKLLEKLPNSSVTAVEINPVLIEVAAQYLQNKANEQLRIVEASIMDIGLPDNSFDFAIARLIFQHLSDPIGAAKEVLRILKPGGKLVIIDSDKDLSWILDPPIPELQLIRKKVLQAQATKGGNGLIGRRLWRILQAAGFQNLDMETIAIHSDAIGIEVFLPQLDPEQFRPMVQAGLLSEQEMVNLYASHKKFLASPNPFVLLLWLIACGHKF